MRPKLDSVSPFDFTHSHWALRYGAVLLFVGCALLLNSISAIQSLPFLFFFAAVAVSARLCGFGPAVFATFVSAAVADFFLMPPQFAPSLSPADLVRLLSFVLVSMLISSLAQQRSAVERMAEKDRATLAAIVLSSEDAIFSKTLDGTITTWNQSAQKLYGYTQEEIIGKNVTLLADHDRKDEILGILDKLRRGEKVEHYETQRLRKEGTPLDISLSVSPLFDGNGNIIGAASIARDITARKLAEEVLRKTEKLAAAGRLSASIAHEINNPLEAVTNLLYLLQKNTSLDDRARKHLTLADQELRRVAHLAKQTLGFYRDSSSPVSLHVSQALDEVLGLYLRKLDACHIKIERDYDQGVEIIAFPGEIRQVFSNLIANAIDAMADGGRLQLRVAKARRWDDRHSTPGVRITVADSGSGIDARHKRKLFEPFYTTKKDVGTGLGLWLSKEIVEKHEGKITVRSSVRAGKTGSVFSVFLPRQIAREKRGSVDPATAKPTALRSQRLA